MCDPVTGFAIASVVLGHKMKYDKAEQARKKQKSLTQREIARQKALEQLARAKQNTALNKFGKGNIESEMQGEGSRLAELFIQNVGGQVAKSPMIKQRGPKILEDYESKAFASAGDAARTRGKNLANLNAFGNALGNVAPAMSDAQRQRLMSSNFMGASADALKRELSDARDSAYSPLGDLLANLGMVGVNYSLKGDPKKKKDPEVIS